ncbi:Protein of unknown function [Gryllus bimaculatus]|nr:Protein of unknown function [Gryllus bimaculatus]
MPFGGGKAKNFRAFFERLTNLEDRKKVPREDILEGMLIYVLIQIQHCINLIQPGENTTPELLDIREMFVALRNKWKFFISRCKMVLEKPHPPITKALANRGTDYTCRKLVVHLPRQTGAVSFKPGVWSEGGTGSCFVVLLSNYFAVFEEEKFESVLILKKEAAAEYNREMEESVPRINPNWHLANPRLPPRPECPADQKWKDLAAGVDEKFKDAEEHFLTATADIQNYMQTVSDHIKKVHSEIEADMDTKSSELIEKKLKEVEERLCNLVDRNLKSMDKKLRRVEKAVSDEMEQVGTLEAVADGQTQLPDQAFRNGREGEICSDTRMRMEAVDKKVGALEKSVAKAMYHLLPKVDALFQNLDIKSKTITNDQITLSIFAAAGYRLPPATPYWVSDLSILSLDKELLMASYLGEMKKVKGLLYQGADKNVRCAQGYTPLHLAAKKGHIKVLNVLLEEDADFARLVLSFGCNYTSKKYIGLERFFFCTFSPLIASKNAMDDRRKIVDNSAELNAGLEERCSTENSPTDSESSSEGSLDNCISDGLKEDIMKIEATIISSVRSMQDALLQKTLEGLPDSEKQVLEALNDELKDRTERKVQERVREISQKVEEKLQAMNEKINAAEEKIGNGKSNVNICGVHHKEEPSTSSDEDDNDLFSKIMLLMRVMHERLNILEAAVKNLAD